MPSDEARTVLEHVNGTVLYQQRSPRAESPPPPCAMAEKAPSPPVLSSHIFTGAVAASPPLLPPAFHYPALPGGGATTALPLPLQGIPLSLAPVVQLPALAGIMTSPFAMCSIPPFFPGSGF